MPPFGLSYFTVRSWKEAPKAQLTLKLVMHGLMDALSDAGQPVLEGQGDLRLVQKLVTTCEAKERDISSSCLDLGLWSFT